MKNVSILTSLIVIVIGMLAFAPPAGKYVSTNTHIKFFSTTPLEDIEANNYAAISSLDATTGDLIFSVPMQGFEFEKSLMQKHFNQPKFLDTKQYPRASLKGKIVNIDQINFEKDGKYQADVQGELTIHGVTNPIREKGTITVKGNTFEVDSKFDVTLADYGVTFVKGKPSSNIAKTVEVTIRAEYQPE